MNRAFPTGMALGLAVTSTTFGCGPSMRDALQADRVSRAMCWSEYAGAPDDDELELMRADFARRFETTVALRAVPREDIARVDPAVADRVLLVEYGSSIVPVPAYPGSSPERRPITLYLEATVAGIAEDDGPGSSLSLWAWAHRTGETLPPDEVAVQRDPGRPATTSTNRVCEMLGEGTRVAGAAYGLLLTIATVGLVRAAPSAPRRCTTHDPGRPARTRVVTRSPARADVQAAAPRALALHDRFGALGQCDEGGRVCAHRRALTIPPSNQPWSLVLEVSYELRDHFCTVRDQVTIDVPASDDPAATLNAVFGAEPRAWSDLR